MSSTNPSPWGSASADAADKAWGDSTAGKFYKKGVGWYDWIRANFWKIIFVLVTIIVSLSAFVVLNNSGRTWTAMLCLALFILLSTVFYRRWFGANSRMSPYATEWPPIINTCPDYLVYFKNGKTDTCIDLLGINRTGGMLRPWTSDDNPNNPPADSSKYFPAVYKPGMSGSELENLKQIASSYPGLTWEGIIAPDGGENGCTFQNAPPGSQRVCTTVPGKATPPSVQTPLWASSSTKK